LDIGEVPCNHAAMVMFYNTFFDPPRSRVNSHIHCNACRNFSTLFNFVCVTVRVAKNLLISLLKKIHANLFFSSSIFQFSFNVAADGHDLQM